MDGRAILMGLAFAFMWSSAFTSARIIVAEAPPMLSLALRFLISGGIGVALALILGQSLLLTRGQWWAVVVFGICQNALYLGLNFIAMQSVEASLAAIIASSLPLLVGAANWIWFRERLPSLGIFGLFAGFAGVALIMGPRLTADLGPGIALCVIGVIALTVATLALRNATSGGNLLMVVGLQMLVGSVALALPGALLETWEVTWTPRLTLAFAYTTIFPGLVATFVWFLLVGRIGATRAATFHFLNPVFGVAVAAALLGEALGLWDVIGVLIITGAILAVQVSRARS